MSMVNNLDQWIRSLRCDARERGGALIFSAIPLFVVLGALLSEDELLEAFSVAKGGGPYLEPDDDLQTTKLEKVMLDQFTRYGLKMDEFLSVEWEDVEELATIDILVATFVEQTALVLYRPDHLPSFQAVAIGDRSALHTILVGDPELALPRLAKRGAKIREVRVFQGVPWTDDDLRKILDVLIGAPYPIEAVVGAARLVGGRDLTSHH